MIDKNINGYCKRAASLAFVILSSVVLSVIKAYTGNISLAVVILTLTAAIFYFGFIHHNTHL